MARARPLRRSSDSRRSLPVRHDRVGRFADKRMTTAWVPPKSRAGCNHSDHIARHYDWRDRTVVENVGYADQYVRRMTDDEAAASLLDLATGELLPDPVSYSQVTGAVFRRLDEFGFPMTDDRGNAMYVCRNSSFRVALPGVSQ